MTKACLVKTDKSIEYIEVDGLKDIQRLVNGFIEAIDFGDNKYFCYANEESKIMGLEPNDLVTSLWYDSGQTILLGDYIGGDVVFFGGIDDDGNNVDISADFADVFNRYL